MTMINKNMITYAGLALFGILGPILFPQYTLSIAYLWMMVLMASTWDTLGGQMGYNSLGNITFFGVGMYISAIVQVSFFYEGGVGEYTSAMGSIKPEFTAAEYFWGLGLGILGIPKRPVLNFLMFLGGDLSRVFSYFWESRGLP